MKQSREQAIFAGALVIVAMATRLLFNYLHIYNFSAVMAAGLFAGAYFASKRMSIFIPLVTMFATDLVLGLYDWKSMLIVDGALMLSVFFGWFYSSNRTLPRWVAVVLGSSTLFFLITNAAVWLLGDGNGNRMYPMDFSGLVASYNAGIPFYRDRLIGDLTWSVVLFGSYELMRLKVGKRVAVVAQ